MDAEISDTDSIATNIIVGNGAQVSTGFDYSSAISFCANSPQQKDFEMEDSGVVDVDNIDVDGSSGDEAQVGTTLNLYYAVSVSAKCFRFTMQAPPTQKTMLLNTLTQNVSQSRLALPTLVTTAKLFLTYSAATKLALETYPTTSGYFGAVSTTRD